MMRRKKSETLSPHFSVLVYLILKEKKIMKHGGIYVRIPLTDRVYITLTIPLCTVPTEEVLEVDVTPFSWQRKVYYFLSFSFLFFALFIVESRSSKKKQDHMLSPLLSLSPYLRSGFSVFSPLFPLSVCCLSVPF